MLVDYCYILKSLDNSFLRKLKIGTYAFGYATYFVSIYLYLNI